MARASFGGGVADFVVSAAAPGDPLRFAPAVLTFWDAETGGTQYTDLLWGGDPVTAIPVSTDGQIPTFQGPDGVVMMWAQAGDSGPRAMVDAAGYIATLAQAAATDAEIAQAAAEAAKVAAEAVGSTNDSIIAGRINDSSSATAAALSASYATMTPITKFGAVGDGVADDSPAFAAANAAASLVRAFYVPAGTYRLSESFEPAAGTNWTLDPAAVLRPAADFDVLVMTPKTRVRGGTINCELLDTFTSAAVLFDGKFPGGSNHVLADMLIRGNAPNEGTGIKLTCTTSGDFIDWVLVDNVYLTNFDKLIHLAGTTSGTWVNGNVFKNLTFGDCMNAVYLEGVADGNVFDFTGQAGAAGERVIYCATKVNTFTGYVFDIAAGSNTPLLAEFTSAAQNNTIIAPPHLSPYVKDNGTATVIPGKNYETTRLTVFEPSAGFVYTPAQNSLIVNSLGNQDDWLAGSYVRHTITQTSGPALTSGALGSLTNPNPSLAATWTTSDASADIVYEIDLSAEKLGEPRVMGLMFEYGQRAKTVKVEIVDDVGGAQTVYETTTNDKDLLTIQLFGRGHTLGSVNKIRVTLARPKRADGLIRQLRIWATSAAAIGQAWASSVNPTLRGIVQFRNNAFAAPGTPSGGGAFYVENGVARWRSSVGTVTSLGGDVVSAGGNYPVKTTDGVVLCTGGASGITVTLPAAARGGRHTIKKVDGGAGAVTVATTGGLLIDGAATKALAAQYDRVTVVTDGVAWYVIG